MSEMRFCELDLNLMSPITWGVYQKCHNTVKHYMDFFGNLSENMPKAFLRDHSVIFYGAIKQLI